MLVLWEHPYGRPVGDFHPVPEHSIGEPQLRFEPGRVVVFASTAGNYQVEQSLMPPSLIVEWVEEPIDPGAEPYTGAPDEDCAVCLGRFGTVWKRFSCGHGFHPD